MTQTQKLVLEAPVYSQKGEKVSSQTLSNDVFGVAWNADLVHNVVVSMQGNARAQTAHTKTRDEVRGGGKKPWKQKGTGRARHGSTRSPIWSGGGVAHGPRNDRDYTRKINKNMRARALASVLSKKFADNEVVFLDQLLFSGPKTAEARACITALARIEGKEALARKKMNTAIILIPERDENTELSFRNFGNMTVVPIKDVNPVQLLTYKYVIVAKPADALTMLAHRVSTKSVRKAVTVNQD